MLTYSQVTFLVYSDPRVVYSDPRVVTGGAVSASDLSRDWLRLPFPPSLHSYLGQLARLPFRPPLFAEYEQYGRSLLPPELGFRLTALRELFEETGLLAISAHHGHSALLTADPAHPPRQHHLRALHSRLPRLQEEVHAEPERFYHLFASLPPSLSHVVPAAESLVEWSNWLTPPIFPENKRFDTLFYLLPSETAMPCVFCTKVGIEW